MAVVFQLFCAEDLLKLNAAQLDDLKTTVRQALENSPRVLGAVKSRANEVFQQLTSQPATQPVAASEASRGMLLQLFNDADLKLLNAQQLDILKMAISCAVFHTPEALQAVKEEADTLFVRYTGQHPKESDVYYGNI
jgi:hypothetical protein